MHLHRLGAAGAASVTSCADGASWIWDRIPIIASKAELKKENVHQVLDNCHAAHHIPLALAALGLNESFQLRAQVISQRWDDCQSNIRALSRTDARTEWRWTPRPMSCKDEANSSSSA